MFISFVGICVQQIANMTGLRVETVIRTVKKMKRDKKVYILKPKNFTFKKGIANLFQFGSCSKTNNQTDGPRS